MSWRLTPEERRIIERTRREGEEVYKSQNAVEQVEAGMDREGRGTTPGNPLWRSVLIWVGGIVIMVVLAMSMVWVGSLIR